MKTIIFLLMIWLGIKDKEAVKLPIKNAVQEYSAKQSIEDEFYSSKDAKAVLEFPCPDNYHDLMDRWEVPKPPPIVHPPVVTDVNFKMR